MSKDFFADINKEGEDPFAQFDKENETPSESQPENKEDKEEPDQGEKPKEDAIDTPKDNTDNEEDTPFHIRWKAQKEKLEQEFNEKLEAYKKEIEQKVESTIKHEDSDIPEWFIELHGDNPKGWQKYQEREKIREEEIKKSVLQEYEEQQKSKQEESKKWEKWVDDEVNALEAEGKKFDRNELIKTVIEFRPTDENNNFDFRKGYAIMEAIKAKNNVVDKEASNERKKIADIATKSASGDAPKKDFMTPADLRGKTWNQI